MAAKRGERNPRQLPDDALAIPFAAEIEQEAARLGRLHFLGSGQRPAQNVPLARVGTFAFAVSPGAEKE